MKGENNSEQAKKKPVDLHCRTWIVLDVIDIVFQLTEIQSCVVYSAKISATYTKIKFIHSIRIFLLVTW